jgi:hypothetical protein
MPSEKDLQLVAQLIEATNNGRISWEPTATPDEFTTSFRGKYSVIVANQGSLYTFRMLDDSGREMLKLEYNSEYYSDHLSAVERLFELARRTGLRVDQAVDEILHELQI